MGHALITAYLLPLWHEAKGFRRPLWKLHQKWNPSPQMGHLTIGAIGEDLAAQFLKQQGYKVLLRNYQPVQSGEIDLIARHGDTLVFVEVKTRTSAAQKRPLLAVTKKKRRLLKKGARSYLNLLNHVPPYRFDVVEVVLVQHQAPRLNIVYNIEIP